MKPGSYGEILERIRESKSVELQNAARLSFSEKLSAVSRSTRSINRMLSDGFPETVFKLLALFNEGVANGLFGKYAIARGFAVDIMVLQSIPSTLVFSGFSPKPKEDRWTLRSILIFSKPGELRLRVNISC